MTDQSAFSQDEWEAIRSVPLVAGLAVARATPSGVWGGLAELRTLVVGIGRAARDETGLVGAIVDDHPRWHLARLTGSDTADPDAILVDAVEICAEARAVIDERATPVEAERFRRWVGSIARKVATAYREDDRTASEQEVAAIQAIDAALRGA